MTTISRSTAPSSSNESLKVWSSSTGEWLGTLLGQPTNEVVCSHLGDDDLLVSGSRDKTVRLWSVREGKCLHTLEGHEGTVWCVQFNGRRLVASSGEDRVIKIWDTGTANCLHTLRGHSDGVGGIEFYGGDHLVSASWDNSVRVWDSRTGACLHTIPVSSGFCSFGENVALQENILITANEDNSAKIWDILTGCCLLTLGGPNKHRGSITSIQCDNKSTVVTTSGDGTIKIWDVNTGDFIRNLLVLEEGEKVRDMKMKDAKIVVWSEKRSGEEKIFVLNFDIKY